MKGKFDLPGLSHFKNDNGWTGSLGVLCYEIEPPREGRMRAVTWYGPFCRKYAREEAESVFPLTQEGIAEMGAWLSEQAEEMNTRPRRTPEECRVYYERLRRGEEGRG